MVHWNMSPHIHILSDRLTKLCTQHNDHIPQQHTDLCEWKEIGQLRIGVDSWIEKCCLKKHGLLIQNRFYLECDPNYLRIHLLLSDFSETNSASLSGSSVPRSVTTFLLGGSL